VTGLLSLSRKDDEEDSSEIALLIQERGVLCEKLGQEIIENYRDNKVSASYIPGFSNEEKKLKYLIEQKENQREKMQEESSKSTFLSFIRESVSRFTSEKQVDSRMTSLLKQLSTNYRNLGDKAIKDTSLKLDEVQYSDLPMKIRKINNRIIALQRELESS